MTDQEIRVKALSLAIDWCKGKSYKPSEVLDISRRFEEFIKIGRI